MPKLTETIIGHSTQQQQLRSDIESKNITHAYLFSGQQHLGKMSLALRFARDILAADVAEEERPHLHSRIEKLTHPDLVILDQLWIEGVCEDWDTIAKYSNVQQAHRAKKPGAKTDVISIDDIRLLQERLIETGTGTHRVCIIRSMERMQDAAANAFLKMLEEPPQGLVFILTTENVGTLLPTIVSRCRSIAFRTVPSKDIKILLSGTDEDDHQFILHMASGCPGLAVQLRDDPDLLRLHRTVHGTAQSFWRSHSMRERLQVLVPLHKRGEDADTFLLHLGLTLREQAPDVIAKHAIAYNRLAADLRTNAHRQLLAQQFALSVDS